MPFHSTTIFTLAYLLPGHLLIFHNNNNNNKTHTHTFKLAILYNKSIADAHPSFLLEDLVVHLVLENTLNVLTWLSVLPWYFINFTTSVPNRHVDIDSDTDHHLISKWYLIDIETLDIHVWLISNWYQWISATNHTIYCNFCFVTFMVSCNIYGHHTIFLNIATYHKCINSL